MKGVNSDVISEVRARANIQEVISEVVVLKRSGKEYKGLCPFHNEKTPSFHVNTDKGIFKCFGCNEGGDVFAFVQKTKGIGFYDSVRELAGKYGVQLVETEQERIEHDKKSQVFMLYEQAAVYYQKLLLDSQEGVQARDYLKKRGITEETINKFRLGYAPNVWDGLLSYLTGNSNVSQQSLAEAGLVRKKQNGNSHFDLFRNRLMIPICDDRGRVIAFGGRTLGDDQIKYLNSPETPIYHKGKHLFALNLAKEHIKKQDSVIVVEGYFDAITPHQYGFSNTVATLGTALTVEQAKLLVRYTDSKKVYLSFDSDDAGQRATKRGVETLGQIAEGIGIELRIIRVPGGKDPDECLTSHEDGKETFSNAIENAPLLLDYQIEEALSGVNLKSHTGRIDAAKKVVPVVSVIKNAVARVEYIRQLAGQINIREEELLSDVRQYRREHRLDTESRFGQNQGYRNNNYGSGYKNQSGQGRPPFKSKDKGSDYSGSSKFNGNSNSGGYRKNENQGSYPPRQEQGRYQSQPQQMNPLMKRSSAPSGHTEAEKELLSLYLTSREDYKRVYDSMLEEKLLTPEHQKIKDTIEGIGTNFDTMEDLRCRLQDRLAPDERASAYLTEIILRADLIKKQDMPIDVVLIDYRSRILKERLTSLIQHTRSRFSQASSDSEETEIQTTINKLHQLTVELGRSKSLDELVTLKNKIEPIEAKYIKRPNTESIV